MEKYVCPAAVRRFLDGASDDAYRLFGCHYIKNEAAYRFAVFAPNAESVHLTGDFCKWADPGLPMDAQGDGIWSVTRSEAERGGVYKYRIKGANGKTVLKADPFAFHSETGPATGSKVWGLPEHSWRDGAYLAKREELDPHSSPINIYEVHLGSWRLEAEECYPNYRRIAKPLAQYCKDMGYTHIELLPVTEYPFDGSWGYQVTGYFAPTSRYGTPEDFMSFVDHLHSYGIGVIIDFVPAHFPRDGHGLALFDGTPLYERKNAKMASHPNWGTLIFDYESPMVRSFLISSAAMFADVYHVDGFRVDAVSSMLYLDFGRERGDFIKNRNGGSIDLGAVQFLQDFNRALRRCGIITVAEESSAYPHVTGDTKNDAGLGFTFKWDMGFMHDTLDYLALDPLWRRGSHEKLTFSMMYAFSESFILAFSHDEVVHGKKSMLDKMHGDYDAKFSTLRTLYAYQFAHPGKKLGFMGGEFGQFIEWDNKKQLDWLLLEYPRHDELRRFCKKLGKLYLKNPALYERDGGWDGFAWLNVDDRDRSCIAFMRTAGDGGDIVCAFNFSAAGTDLKIGLPGEGTLRLVLNSDEPGLGGSGVKVKKTVKSRKKTFDRHPFFAILSLPPLSALYYRFKAQ